MTLPNILFRTRDEVYVLHPENIAYVHACEHYCNVYYVSGVHIFLPFRIADVENRLKESGSDIFLRLGRSWIVNVAAVKKINIPKGRVSFSFDCESLREVYMPPTVIKRLIAILTDS